MSEPSPGPANSESDLLPLIEAIYDAAVRPAAWTGFLSKLSAAVESQSSCIQTYDAATGSGIAMWWHGIPDEAIAHYPDWAGQNPHLQAIAPFLRTGIVVPNTLVPKSDFLKTDFFNGFSRLYDPIYPTAGGVIYGNGATNVTIGIHRALEGQPFEGRVGRILSVLMPHLQRAIVVHKKLGDADLERAVNLDTINRLTFGVVLLSRDGAVVEMNDAAQQMVSEGNTLELTARGQLRTVNIRDQAKLETLLADVCHAAEHLLRPSGGALAVTRNDSRPPLILLASPLRLRQFNLALAPPVAVLFLQDPERTTLPISRLQQIYGLTVAEARIAERLKTGESVNDLSGSLHISVATARTHIRHLLEKVGARSLSDLTRRIAGLTQVR